MAKSLSSREKDVKEEIDDSMQRTHECAGWLEDVEKMMENVEELKTRYTEAMNGCHVPCSLHNHLKLSKDIVKVKNSLVNLRDQMKTDHPVREARCPDRIQLKSSNSTIKLPSQREHVEKLLELLTDETIKKIGLWGMFGVGKTTILESLNNEAEKLTFNAVLWVIVEEKNLHQMQEEILERLKVKTKHQSEAEHVISKSLKKKKYLLLLDEVYSSFDLCRIGFRDNHDCKVVLACRERGICKEMETDEEIKVEKLSRDDARKLFRNIVGDFIDHCTIEPIAQRVLKQCGDLPHIIRAVGKHLKDSRRLHFWEQALLKLESPNMYQLDHLEDVFKSFEMIFEELDDILKDCLLYAASFPENHEIYRDYLVECWMAHELVPFRDTFRSARNEGHTSLDKFIAKCLFDSCKGSKAVKMPIIFRKTALIVAKQRNFELLENPQVGSWTRTNAKVISFTKSSDLKELPDGPNCCMLSILFLQWSKSLSMIPQSFFHCMSALKFLDLGGTSIRDLPSSISNLISLKGLYLNNCCNLVHFPEEIERLEILEFLDIRRIGIHGFGFPVVIGRLTCLKCLRVSFTSVVANQSCLGANGIKGTPSSTIQQLLQLEELTIDADPKEPNWNMIAPTIAAEIARLGKLSTLSFYFSSTESFETFTQTSISWKSSSPHGSNFRSFNIYIGKQTFNSPELDVSECVAPRHLYYSGGRDIPNSIKEVLRFTTAFELIDHQNIINFSDFGIDEMKPLEVCRIKECNAMTFFLTGQMPAIAAFRWLRELQLLQLDQLKAICQGPNITSGSFAELTTLTIDDCPNLIEVVSWETAEQLLQLRHLEVENCARVKEIVAGGNQSGRTAALPKLKTLKLGMLESLVSIHSNDSFEWRELQDIDIDQCDMLANLCLSTKNATKLRRIKCSIAWWQAMINEEVRSDLKGVCHFC